MADGIERLRDFAADALDALVVESEQAGSTFVRRLVDDWVSGINRFDRPGEAMWVDGRLIGVCGLNVDPYTDAAGVGRVRHLFYVLTAFRRLGAGRKLVNEVIATGRASFNVLRLRTTNPAAARLYEALGFRPTQGSVDDATHILELARGRSLAGA